MHRCTFKLVWKKGKKKEKRKKKREAFRVLKYCVQGFEICNVEGSLKEIGRAHV